MRYCVASRSAPSGDHDNDARGADSGRRAVAGLAVNVRHLSGKDLAASSRQADYCPGGHSSSCRNSEGSGSPELLFFSRKRKGRFQAVGI